MEFVKNNILSILCGVVVLVAIVVPFWPMGGYRESLESRLAERVTVYNSLNDVRTKSRTLPVVNPDNPTPQPLEVFPNEQIIAKGNEVKTAFETQSKQLMDEVIKLNRHTLLVPGSLPAASSTSLLFRFRDQYRDAIANGFPRMLKRGIPPTAESIKLATEKLYNAKYRPQLGGTVLGSAPGMDRAKQNLLEEFKIESERIPQQERERVATSSLIYMNPDALPFNQVFNANNAPQPADVWYAQLDLWLIEDVAKAILETNAGAKSVLEAPVKHLIRVDVPKLPNNPYVLGPGQALDGELTGPAPKVTDLGVAGGSPSPVPMVTGRVSNPLYDVVHFNLVVNVEAASIVKFIQTLSKNRFITVLETSVTAVDSNALKQQGFLYGDKPVVQLTLKCEAIFFHKWSRELMPKVVADALTGQPGAVPGMGPSDMMY